MSSSYYDRGGNGVVGTGNYHLPSNSYYFRQSGPTTSGGTSSAFSPIHYIDEPRQLAPTLPRGFDEVDKFLRNPTAQETDGYWADQRQLQHEHYEHNVPRLPAKDYAASPPPLITRLDKPPQVHSAHHNRAEVNPADHDYAGQMTQTKMMELRESPPRLHQGTKRLQEGPAYAHCRLVMPSMANTQATYSDYSPYMDAPLRNTDAEYSFARSDKRRKSSALKSIRHFIRKHLRLSPSTIHRADGFDLTVDRMVQSQPSPPKSRGRSKSPFSPSGRRRLFSASSNNVNGVAVASIHHQPPPPQNQPSLDGQPAGEKRPPLVRAQSFSSSKTLQQQRGDPSGDEMDAFALRAPSASGSPVKYQQRAVSSRATSSVQPLSRIIPLSSGSATKNGDAGGIHGPDSKRYRSIAIATPCQLGIANHGNTCYMNAILQCLACLERFAELFVCQPFPTTPASITSTLAITLQSLWFNAAADGPCLRLLRLIAEANPHFQIFYQQDAQESLIWLLDRIHEEIRDGQRSALSDGRYQRLSSDFTMQLNKSEEELASAALRRVSGHNNRSAIMDLFRAQFRSSMECTTSGCDFYNLTFDPYMSVSLSVPQPTRAMADATSRQCTVTLVPFFNRRELIRYRMALRQGRMTSVRDVKAAVMESIGAPPDCAIACKFASNGLCQFLAGDLQIGSPTTDSNSHSPPNKYQSLGEFTLVEIPRLSDTQQQLPEEGGPELVIVIVTFVMGGIVDASGTPPLRHAPYVVVLDRRWSYERIYRTVMEKGAFAFSKRYYPLPSDFRLLLQHSSESAIQLDHTLVMPLHSESVARIVGGSRSGAAATLRLIVEWTPAAGYEFLRREPEPILNDYSFAGNSKSHNEERNGPQPSNNTITLLNLLQDYTKSEELPDWKCPRCFKHSGRKELKFHSLPPILVFHLKRFELLNDGATKKVESRVQIPLDALDMSPYICNSDSCHNTLTRTHSKDHHATSSYLQPSAPSTIYDLVGVVDHFGERTNSGHYTATARNPVDGRWRNFDDLKVSFVPTHEIRSSTNAYLLFYASRTEKFHPKKTPAAWFPYAVPEQIIAMYEASSKSGMDDTMVNNIGSSTFYTSSNNVGDGTIRRRKMEVASPSKKGEPPPTSQQLQHLQQQPNSSPTRSKSHQTLSNIGGAAETLMMPRSGGATTTDGYFYDTSGEPRQRSYARY